MAASLTTAAGIRGAAVGVLWAVRALAAALCQELEARAGARTAPEAGQAPVEAVPIASDLLLLDGITSTGEEARQPPAPRYSTLGVHVRPGTVSVAAPVPTLDRAPDGLADGWGVRPRLPTGTSDRDFRPGRQKNRLLGSRMPRQWAFPYCSGGRHGGRHLLFKRRPAAPAAPD